MLEKLIVIALRVVDALMGTSRLASRQGRVYQRLGHVQHVAQFQRRGQFGIETERVIVQCNILETLAKLGQRLTRAL